MFIAGAGADEASSSRAQCLRGRVRRQPDERVRL